MAKQCHNQHLSNLLYFCGGAVWMAIMMNAALSIPVVGFALMIPAGLVIYAARQAMCPADSLDEEDLILH